ncbi:MAG: hypothetical protein ABI690_30285 [Chloroflexota bacterium]
MKGISLAVVGAILSFIGWISPWLDLQPARYLKGDLLIREPFDNVISLPGGGDPALHVALLLLCYVVFVASLLIIASNANQIAIVAAGVSALLIVFLEIFLLINAAVFSFAWTNAFIYTWQWGILALFAGLALMLWGVVSMFVDNFITQALNDMNVRLYKLEAASQGSVTKGNEGR